MNKSCGEAAAFVSTNFAPVILMMGGVIGVADALSNSGFTAMIMGMGKYRLPEFWKFTVPMYLIRILALSVGAVLLFPM